MRLLTLLGNRLLLLTVFLSVTVGVAPVALAASDTTAPVVSNLTISPNPADLSAGPVVITLSANVTDPSGVASGMFWRLDSETTTQVLGTAAMTRVSGDATAGTWQGTITMPANAARGRWTALLAGVKDEAGNYNYDTPSQTTTLNVTDGQSAAPGAPTGVSAIKGDTSATVSWTAPGNNGGSPITGYTITSTPGGITKTVAGDQTTGTITGLTNGTSYTFTVVATNATGNSPASTPSNAVTPAAVPGAPTGVTAVRGDKSAAVSWTAPANNGGSPITGYTITSTPGGITKTVAGDQTTGTITGLTNGTSYTFTVTATNASGTSPASAASNAITPAAPAEPAPEPELIPSSPTDVKAKTKKGKVVLKWNAPVAGDAATSFLITSNKGYQRSLPANKTKLVVRKLKRGKYKFYIASANEAGLSKPVKIKVRIR